MRWKFWQRRLPKELSKEMREALASKFRLNGPDVVDMRYVEKNGMRDGRPVRYIRIFDTKLASEKGVNASVNYDDFVSPNKALLFEGYIRQEGFLYLADRRAPKASLNNKRQTLHSIKLPGPSSGERSDQMTTQRPGQSGKPGQPSKPGSKPQPKK